MASAPDFTGKQFHKSVPLQPPVSHSASEALRVLLLYIPATQLRVIILSAPATLYMTATRLNILKCGVFFTTFGRSFSPSTSGTTSVRPDSSILGQIFKLLLQKAQWSQIYYPHALPRDIGDTSLLPGTRYAVNTGV